MTSQIEKISHQIDSDNIDTDMFGVYSKTKIECIKKPNLTKFGIVYDEKKKFTNYLFVPKNIVVDKKDIFPVTTIKITNKDCHILTDLNIYLNYYESVHPHNIKKINTSKIASIKLKYKDTILFDFSLADIENILKMCSHHHHFMTHDVKRKQTEHKVLYSADSNILYYVPLQKLLKFDKLVMFDEPLEIEIVSQYDLTSIEVRYDSYILIKDEANRFNTCARSTYVYQYKSFDITTNNVNVLNLSNNIIIDKILVNGDSIISSQLSYNDIVLHLLNSKSKHNKLHREYGKGYKSTFYYFSDNADLHTANGKIMPSENKNVLVTSEKNAQCKLFIQYTNILQFCDGIELMFNAEYSEKEYLFNKYRSYLKHSKDVTDVITEIKEKTNTYPLTHNNDELYYEGYWYDGSKFNKKYPIPILTEEKNSDDFVDKLKLYMKNTEPHQQYFGSSYCRICDACNGGSEYKIDTDDMSIVFPSGLLHYYEMHNVKPSTEFYNVIVALKFDFMNLS